MDVQAVRAAFDQQMRRSPVPEPHAQVERNDRVTRMVGADRSWAAVLWSDLTELNADDAIAGEVAHFTGYEQLEWKHYAHDQPADLPERPQGPSSAAGTTAMPSGRR